METDFLEWCLGCLESLLCVMAWHRRISCSLESTMGIDYHARDVCTAEDLRTKGLLRSLVSSLSDRTWASLRSIGLDPTLCWSDPVRRTMCFPSVVSWIPHACTMGNIQSGSKGLFRTAESCGSKVTPTCDCPIHRLLGDPLSKKKKKKKKDAWRDHARIPLHDVGNEQSAEAG